MPIFLNVGVCYALLRKVGGADFLTETTETKVPRVPNPTLTLC